MPGKKRKRFTAKRAKKSTKDSSDEENEGKFEIDFIEDHRIIPSDDRIEFLVRWKSYGPAENTWEEFEMFAFDAPDVVQDYLIKVLGSHKIKDSPLPP
jgi:hypothetical protein